VRVKKKGLGLIGEKRNGERKRIEGVREDIFILIEWCSRNNNISIMCGFCVWVRGYEEGG
jgi:hypothetical protein